MTKAYLVKEIHDYEKFFIIGVCHSRELAEILRQKNETFWDLEDCEITSERWDEMLMNVYATGLPSKKDCSIEEMMIEAYPEYPVSDITRACGEYMSRSYVSTVIEEINLYESDSDIASYGIDCR